MRVVTSWSPGIVIKDLIADFTRLKSAKTNAVVYHSSKVQLHALNSADFQRTLQKNKEKNK